MPTLVYFPELDDWLSFNENGTKYGSFRTIRAFLKTSLGRDAKIALMRVQFLIKFRDQDFINIYTLNAQQELLNHLKAHYVRFGPRKSKN